MQGMALHGADQGKGNAGAAAGIFDDGAVRRETAVGFRSLDHGESHAVLHAAGGILAFDFEKDAGVVRGCDAAQGQQGSVTNAMQDVGFEKIHDAGPRCKSITLEEWIGCEGWTSAISNKGEEVKSRKLKVEKSEKRRTYTDWKSGLAAKGGDQRSVTREKKLKVES